jgi:RHS repeat-associated protein
VKDYLAKPPTDDAESGLLLTRRYSAFGTPEPAQVWASGPEGNFTDVSGESGFFYVGQEYDAETGLQYSRARYYDPRSREFIGQDPLAFTAGDTNLYRRVGNSPVNATDPSGLETYWEISGYFASTFVHNVGVTVSTAGKTIWKTGEEMGDAIGTHVARTWYSRQDEMTALHETVTTTAAGLSQLAQTVYDDPLGVAQSLGASSLRYLDRLTSDPETSGQLFGHGAVVWASAGAGGAAANATRSIAVAGNLSAAAGRASAAMRRLIPSRRLREGLEEATELTDDLGRAFAPIRGAGAADDLVIDSYGVLRRRSDIPGQAHHLNQDAAFRSRIAQREGASVKLEGNALTGVGTPHYNAHESMESFWDIYRRGGMDARNLPTNSQYNRALYNGLQESGLSPADALRAVQAAKAQQLRAGLRGSDLVPRLPGRINQVPRGN